MQVTLSGRLHLTRESIMGAVLQMPGHSVFQMMLWQECMTKRSPSNSLQY